MDLFSQQQKIIMQGIQFLLDQNKGQSPKTKSDPNPAKRGAQGPRNPPSQGPSQRTNGLQGSRPKPRPQPPKSATPKVSNVGPQIRQAKAVQQANPGRAARAARRGGRGPTKGMLAAGLVAAASSGALRNPISKAKANASRKDGQRATLNGKPVVWSKSKKDWIPAPGRNAGNYNTRDASGKVRSRKKVGATKVGPKKVGTAEKAFDRAFAAARKGGKSVFTWRGKSYSTKLK